MKAKIIGLVLLLAGVLAFYFISLPDLKMAQESSGWPKVSGTITRSDIRRVETGHGTEKKVSYSPEISYSYRVEGRKYQGMNLHVTEGTSYSYRVAGNIRSRYPEGAEVEVSYRPEEPAYALLEPGIRPPEILVASFMLLFALFGLLIIFNVIKPDPKKQASGLAALVFAGLSILQACDKESDDPPVVSGEQESYEDIRVSSDLTPAGGELELSDEKGNKLRLIFPPLALEDTVNVSLVLSGTINELNLEERDIRSFSVLPADLKLFSPVEMILVLSEQEEDLQSTGLFFMEEDAFLLGLGDHYYSASGDTIKASSMRLGDFAEGRIGLERLLDYDQELRERMGLATKGAAAMLTGEYASQWSDTWIMASAVMADMYWLELHGKYDDMPGRSFQSDKEALCNDWVCPGVENVLKMAPPTDNPCDRSYVQTIGDMVRTMKIWGCDACDAYAKVNARYQKIMLDCGTYLDIDITYEVETEDGSVSQENMGPVKLTARFDEYGLVVMEGSGSIPMSGNLKAGDCNGVFSGETQVDVYGYRDADWNYTLYVTTLSSGVVAGSCPGGEFSYPIEGDEEETELHLNPGNEYIYEETEMTDEGGTMEVFIQLFNPWMGMPY